MKRAFIALGSNLNDPEAQVKCAVRRLAQSQHLKVTAESPWYRSVAVGPGEQPDYVNGVIEITTILSANALLALLQQFESDQGRKRNRRWQARTLDLDILWYDNQTIRSETLIVPHPRMCERNFVLFPLRDIAPTLIIDGVSISELANSLNADGIWKI